MITHEYLLAHLKYDPETGIFTRLKSTGAKTTVGRIAGATHNKGYRTIGIGGGKYLAHRLAWFYMTGNWPIGIDHINRDKADNRWVNLREADQSLNMQNRGPNKHKSDPALPQGVTKSGNRYIARAYVDKVRRYLGSFTTLSEAAEAVRSARAVL